MRLKPSSPIWESRLIGFRRLSKVSSAASRPVGRYTPAGRSLLVGANGVRLNYFSMITTVGTPQTVSAEELRLECMFPADDATETGHGRLIQTYSTRRSLHH
jgi:hypothetical protein